MGDSGTISLYVALSSRMKQTLVSDRRTQTELSQARDVEDLKKRHKYCFPFRKLPKYCVIKICKYQKN